MLLGVILEGVRAILGFLLADLGCLGAAFENLWGDIVHTNSALRRGGDMDSALYPYHRPLPQFRSSILDTF